MKDNIRKFSLALNLLDLIFTNLLNNQLNTMFNII